MVALPAVARRAKVGWLSDWVVRARRAGVHSSTLESEGGTVPIPHIRVSSWLCACLPRGTLPSPPLGYVAKSFWFLAHSGAHGILLPKGLVKGGGDLSLRATAGLVILISDISYLQSEILHVFETRPNLTILHSYNISMALHDTIVALSTASGQAAIAVVRLSGSEAIAIVDKHFDKDLSSVKSHIATHGWIRDAADEPIDEVVATIFRGPGSYTSEDVVEVSCHGSDFIVRRLLELFVDDGARPAEPGGVYHAGLPQREDGPFAG